jgi:hypothetical protein
MGRNYILQYPSYLCCSWKLFSPGQLIHIAVDTEMVDIDVWLMNGLVFSCGSSLPSEVNGSGLYVSVFWNTTLYLVEQAISFIVFFPEYVAYVVSFLYGHCSVSLPSSKFQGQVRHLIWVCNRDK